MTLTKFIIIVLGVFLFMTLLILAISYTSSKPKVKKENKEFDLKDSAAIKLSFEQEEQNIKQLIQENIEYCNSENASGYMATLHPNAPGRAKTEEAMESLFETFDCEYKIDEIDIISINDDHATIHIIQTTRKKNGPFFQNNKIDLIETLRKYHGNWKIYSTKANHIEYLN
jgi:hypothetical protein